MLGEIYPYIAVVDSQTKIYGQFQKLFALVFALYFWYQFLSIIAIIKTFLSYELWYPSCIGQKKGVESRLSTCKNDELGVMQVEIGGDFNAGEFPKLQFRNPIRKQNCKIDKNYICQRTSS